MSAQTNNPFNQWNSPYKYVDNTNLYHQYYNNNSYQHKQNYIIDNNNEIKKQKKTTSKTPKMKTIPKNRVISNNNNMQNNNIKENNFKYQQNNIFLNFGNNQNNSNGIYNNNDNNGNMYLNNNNISYQDNNYHPNFEQNKQNELILKILIYIYYYEKDLSEKNIFINSNEEYYLINHIWLIEFKKFYSYNKLKEQLELTTKYDYGLIDIYIKEIINIIPETTKPNYKLLPENLKTNILSAQKGIIFPKKIMNIIYELDKDFIKITKPNRFIFKDNNIYYINNKTIFFGTYKKNALFVPIYIFDYKSKEIEAKEEKKLVYSQINDYIREKKCNTQIYKQYLKTGEEDIGILIIPTLQRKQNIRKNIHSVNISLKDLKINNINNFEFDLKNDTIRNKLNKRKNRSRINVSNNSIQENFNQNNRYLNIIYEDNNKMKTTYPSMTELVDKKDEGKELLKAFIYIYYYEKALREKNIFLNNNESYYLSS